MVMTPFSYATMHTGWLSDVAC